MLLQQKCIDILVETIQKELNSYNINSYRFRAFYLYGPEEGKGMTLSLSLMVAIYSKSWLYISDRYMSRI